MNINFELTSINDRLDKITNLNFGILDSTVKKAGDIVKKKVVKARKLISNPLVRGISNIAVPGSGKVMKLADQGLKMVGV